MSCNHTCGCSPEIRDARTDEWVQIAPESARPRDARTARHPDRMGIIFLTRGTIVEADWSNGNRSPVYVDEGGYQVIARWVGNGKPLQWLGGRIVRVLTEEKPAQEPALPRQIAPEDVRVGMVVERRKGEAAHRDRVQQIDGERIIVGTDGSWLWVPGNADGGWALWLVEDAPAPVDPPDPDAADAAFIEAIITAYRRSPECSTHAVFGEAMLDHLRAQGAWRSAPPRHPASRSATSRSGFDVTARAEQ
jgi:hypothetical protein